MKRFLVFALCAALCCPLFGGCLQVRKRGTGSVTGTADETAAQSATEPTGDTLAAALAEQARQIAAFETRLNELEHRESREPDTTAGEQTGTTGPTEPAGTTETIGTDALYRYTVSEDGMATVTGYVGTEKTVVIPATLGGCPVVAIGEEAFKNGTPAAVVIPEGVRRVDWFAFGGCYRLSSVTVPETVVAIGYGAFDLCSPALCFICTENSYAAGYAKSYGISVVAP